MDFDQVGGKIPVSCHRPILVIRITEDIESSFSLLVTQGAGNILDNTVKIKKYLNKLEQSAKRNKIKLNKNRYESSTNPFYMNRMKRPSFPITHLKEAYRFYMPKISI